MIADFFDSGRVFDLVLAVLAVEAAALALLWRRAGRGLPPGDALPFLLAGGCLVAACRATSLGASWQWTAGFLALAFAAHVFELMGRWRTGG